MYEKIIFLDYSDLKEIFLDNFEKNLLYIENLFPNVVFIVLPTGFKLKSENNDNLEIIENLIRELVNLKKKNLTIDFHTIDNIYTMLKSPQEVDYNKEEFIVLKYQNNKEVRPKNKKQDLYIRTILKNTIVFGVGPAGTGKTFLATAVAVSFLQLRKVDKIVLVRPAVEAGESLGFLPGDLEEKLDPYLRPLYDSLLYFFDHKMLEELRLEKVIEIVPLAYMRGRTLDNSFIILDEAQNTTKLQMKMFLTRLGNNSKMVINGDLSQIDLNEKDESGLIHALQLLQNIENIAFVKFTDEEIVRHPLVIKILERYNLE